MAMQVYPHISADASVLSGQPVIEGTSVPVSVLVSAVAAGKSLDEVAREHGVTVADVRAALEYAAQRAGEPAVAATIQSETSGETSQTLVDQQAVEEEAHRVGLDPAQLSPLGRRLLELRVQGIAAGEQLLSTWDELEAEIRDRRGGTYPDAE